MTAGQIALSLGISLVLTMAVELPFTAIAKRNPKDLLISALANLATNPLVNALHIILVLWKGLPALPTVAFLEICAVLAEALLYRICSEDIRRPLLFSLGANAASFSLGLAVSGIVSLIQ
ncbi:MAG: hypothetical protein IKZ19_09335 [Clostridia bacterium]|nr:hypothetical protein [Clostridia bacterium]